MFRPQIKSLFRQSHFPQRKKSEFGLQQQTTWELHQPALCAWVAWREPVWRHHHCPAPDTQRCRTTNVYVHVWFRIGGGAKQAVNWAMARTCIWEGKRVICSSLKVLRIQWNAICQHGGEYTQRQIQIQIQLRIEMQIQIKIQRWGALSQWTRLQHDISGSVTPNKLSASLLP